MRYKEYSHIRKVGSPGYDLEKEFYNELWDCELVDDVFWLSESKKATFDFQVNSKAGMFLIDVVGFRYQYHSISLYTHHKDWIELLNYAHDYMADACYLAYKPYEIDNNGFNNWRFLKITENLPRNNLYISRSRARHAKTYSYLFSDKRAIKTKLAEKLKRKYALRKEANEKLNAWIYGNVPA